MKKLANLIYLENMRLPTEKAHGIQIMKMCEAFAKSGIKVILSIPSFNKDADRAFDYYGAERIFEINHRYKTINFQHLNALTFIARTLFFFLSFRRSRDYKKADVIFVRDTNLAFLSAIFGIPFIWEVHQDFYSRRAGYALKRSLATIFISRGLKEKFLSYGISDSDKLYICPDAVGSERLEEDTGEQSARQSVGLPLDVPIVLYSGHLYEWKGAHVLAEAAALSRGRALFVFVGGTDEDVATFRGKYGNNSNIMILGRKPYSEMSKYKQSATVLAIPNSARFEISKSYTSPLKLFSAMASRRPIVASDLPSLREIIDDSMAFFVRPDDPAELARMIDYVLLHPKEAQAKAAAAFTEAKKYTWDARAASIREAIESHLP